MFSQMQSQSLTSFYFNKFPIPTKMIPLTLPVLRAPFSIRVRSSTTSSQPPLISQQQIPNSPLSMQSLVVAVPPNAVPTNLGFRPTLELGLLSNLFVLSMAFGAFFSVALVSIPTLIAFGRLGASVKKLSKVVSEEVPGTLYSLKLSSLELSDLTQQLGSLRHIISDVRMANKDRKPTSSRSFHNKS